jgi:uncharacterized protein YbjT (DUF2867 family)
MEQFTAIVAGATGMVGTQLVQQLIEDERFPVIKIFTRRTTGIHHPKIREHIINFDRPDEWKHLVTGDVLFSALGTTLKQAGSKEEQYKIDFTYQYRIAEAAANNGAKVYVLISAAMASEKSRIFYSRMKGQLERAVKDLRFDHIHILQPGMLVGDRKEERKGEKLGISVLRFMNRFGIAKKHKPIDASTVAQAMINVSFRKEMMNTYALLDLFELAREKDPHSLSLRRG